LIKRVILTLALSLTVSVLVAAETLPENSKTQALGPLAYKLDDRLIPAINDLHTGKTTDALAATSIKSAHGRALAAAPAQHFAIHIDAVVTDALVKKIVATGATITGIAAQWNTIDAHATLSQIDALSNIAEIRTVRLQAGKRRRQQGSTGNAADTEINAAEVRTTFGVTGKNQIIGVMSDSAIDTSQVKGSSLAMSGTAPNIIVKGSVPQNTGDLPASFQVVDPGPGGGSDEGESMMELIYDLAPGASLAFASAGNTQTSAAVNLLALRTAAKCTVTVDDVAFLDEPYFQDGPWAQAISTNAANGVIHFSAWGNDGTNGVSQTYTPVNTGVTTDDKQMPPSGNDFHNWGIGGATPGFLPITLSPGDDLTVVLQWNQPYASYNLGAGSQADLDLFLYSSPAIGTPLAKSASPQGTAGAPKGDPFEILDYFNKGSSTVTVYLAINHFQGVRGNALRLLFTDSNLDMAFPMGGVNGQSAYGHPTNKDCVGVGAINFSDIQANNLKPESFSSLGGFGSNGIPFYFDNSGNLLPNAPVLRSGPDLASPDGVDTSFFKNFLGTSCSAPNACAVAALLLEAAPGTSPAMLTSVLKSSARDATGAPATTGPDGYTGFGLVDATVALKALVPPPVLTSPTTASGNVASFFSYTITATGFGTLNFSATNLPAGLSLNGATISGLPTTQGTFTSVSVSAANVVGTVTQTVTISIGPQLPVRVLSQVGATPNPVPSGATVTFSVDAVSDTQKTLTFMWDFGDGTSGSGSNTTHAYSIAGTFISTVTVSDGTVSVSSNVTVVVTPQATFVSQASATPGSAGVGQSVMFSAAATEGSISLTYKWDFGDGSSDSGANVSHAYNSPGTYTGTVTVTDAVGGTIQSSVMVTVKAPLVGTGKDSDGDGFSDSFELAVGSDPNDPSSTPLNGQPASTPLTLQASRTSIRLNFMRDGNDALSFSGTLPISAGFNANGQRVVIDLAGVANSFKLDSKGSAGRGTPNMFKLQFRSTRGTVAAQTAKFTVKFNKGSFASTLADSGLSSDPSTSGPVSVMITVLFNGSIYQTTQSLLYTNKTGKTGMAK
jgi:PKD repeat protein